MNILKANMPKNQAGKDLLKEKLCFFGENRIFLFFSVIKVDFSILRLKF